MNGQAPGIGADSLLVGHAWLAPGLILSGGRWHLVAGAEVESRMIDVADYGLPGKSGVRYTEVGNSELSVRASGGGVGVADLRVMARAWMVTWYWKDLVPTTSGKARGFDLLAGLGPGYEYRIHQWELDKPFPVDAMSFVQIPGLYAEGRRLDGEVRIAARVNAALTFGGTHSIVLDANSGAVPFETLPTPTRAYGYYFAWGPNLGGTLTLTIGRASLSGEVRWNTLYGIDQRDVWPARHPTADLGDSWVEFSARLRCPLPWNGLDLNAFALRGLRWGHADGTNRTVSQTSLFLGLGAAFP